MRHDAPRCRNTAGEKCDAPRSAASANGAIISAEKNKRPSPDGWEGRRFDVFANAARVWLLATARRLLAVGGVVPLAGGLLIGLRLQRDERLFGVQLAVGDDSRPGLVGRLRHWDGVLRAAVVG